MTSTAIFLMMSETIEFRFLFSVTFGHLCLDPVTYGHRFRVLL